MEKYLKANPGRNPLDIILDVDWANVLTLVVNSSNKWERAVAAKKAS